MATTPSCCLYGAFLLHFSAFVSLLVGYSTPNWTLVKMSTGAVHSLGLVVTCDHLKCEMLHVTSARSVFVIIFGMCTFCILLSLFSIQTFCLALCNNSCKAKNIGTCLSYFSLFIAFSIGATLGLYQIDLREEAKPDVMAIWMGWSRYCVMGAAGGFFLGAWMSVADYCLRNRAQKREILKRSAEVKAKLATHQMQQGPGRGLQNTPKPNESRRTSLAERRKQYANREAWRSTVSKTHPVPKMYNTVDLAVMNAAQKREAHHGNNVARGGCKDVSRNKTEKTGIGGGRAGQTIDKKRWVEMATDRGVKAINVKEAPKMNGTSNSGRNPRVNSSSSTCENSVRDTVTRNTSKRDNIVGFSDAALKYRLEKLHQLTTPLSTNDERRKLSAVQEESKTNQRERQMSHEKKVLNRQETKTLVGHSVLQSTTSISIDDSSRPTKLQHSDRDSKTMQNQPSVESRTGKLRKPETAASTEYSVSGHTKPHPLRKDGQISSLDNSFGSHSKLLQTKTTSASLDEQNKSNLNLNKMSRDDLPPLKWGPKKENIVERSYSKTDPVANEKSKHGNVGGLKSEESREKMLGSINSQESVNNSDMSEEQLKRRQIVETMLMSKKNRKKKRITQ